MIRDRESETEVKKIQWLFNRLPRVLYMTETIGSKYKWNPKDSGPIPANRKLFKIIISNQKIE